jgi:hypothetical protein
MLQARLAIYFAGSRTKWKQGSFVPNHNRALKPKHTDLLNAGPSVATQTAGWEQGSGFQPIGRPNPGKGTWAAQGRQFTYSHCICVPQASDVCVMPQTGPNPKHQPRSDNRTRPACFFFTKGPISPNYSKHLKNTWLRNVYLNKD